MTDELTLIRPDDWHLHVRDGAVLADVVPHSAERFGRAVIMPNLKPPVTTTEQALGYRERILAAVPAGLSFEPLMTVYLTDNTPPQEIARARGAGLFAAKLYPAGATTHSDAGVTDVRKIDPVLEALAENSMALLVHGEATAPGVDVFDREKVFIDEVLGPLVERHPTLRVVFEHITTADAVDVVVSQQGRVGATITPQHLLLNRNAMFEGGLRPHHYCLPLIKRERHRQALVAAATGGNPKFFLGTDSAPHPRGAKESDCGCAGIYSARNAMGFYAEVFEDAGALDKLEGFASHYGPDFYGLPRNADRLTLVREAVEVPERVDFGGEPGVPLRAGERVRWRFLEETQA